MFRIATLVALTLTTATATATAAHAESAPALPATHVSYADLKLGSPDGAAELQRRVSRAAKQVCADYLTVHGGQLKALQLTIRCQQIAMASARPQVTAAIGNARYAADARAPIRLSVR